MKPRWLIESTAFDDRANNDESNVHRMLWLLEEMGMEFRVDKYKPFGASVYDYFQDDGPVVFYGSLNMCRDVQKKGIKWKPFAWCDWENLTCRSYYSHYGKYIMAPEYGMYPLAEIPRLRDVIYRSFGKPLDENVTKGIYSISPGHEWVVFIRPDDNHKSFNGHLVSYNNLDRWYEMANIYEPGANCLSVVSTPCSIQEETRIVIADRKPVAASVYYRNRQFDVCPNVKKEALTFAEEVVNSCEWQPASIFVMDVAETDGAFKVLEIGPVNCAGLYKCEIRPIIEAMSAIAEREYYTNITS